jgi:hypothetical protein
MQRTSPALRPPERTDVPAPAAPVELPSLHEALERVRAADVSRAEVDALLRVLALPLPAGEAARERAEVLHGIMEDTWVGGRVGSEGRRVAHAAAEALIELGYPHALEVPPELLAEAREARRRPGSKPRAHWGPEDWARRQRTGARLVVAAGLLECTGLTVYQAMGWLEGTVDAPWGAVMGFLLLSGGVPALNPGRGHRARAAKPLAASTPGGLGDLARDRLAGSFPSGVDPRDLLSRGARLLPALRDAGGDADLGSQSPV